MDGRTAARRSWRFGREVVADVQRDRLVDVAAGVAFWLLLSIPAALLAIVSFTSLLGERITAEVETAIIDLIETTFATESEAIRRPIEGLFDQPRAGLLSASLAVAVFTLSRGFAGLVRALDAAYGVPEGRSFLRVRMLAIVLAIGTLITLTASTIAWIALNTAGVPGWIGALGATGVLVLWAATVFHIGPHHHTPWRYDVPGAVFTAIGWFLMSFGYGWYVQVFGAGGQVVGAIGAALLGLTWLWLVCLVLLGGAEVNAVLARRRGVVQQRATVADRAIAASRRQVRSLRRRARRSTSPEST